VLYLDELAVSLALKIIVEDRNAKRYRWEPKKMFSFTASTFYMSANRPYA